MPAPVGERAILDALHAIPRGDVLRFILALDPDAPAPVGDVAPIRTSADLLTSGLVGLWADRPDLDDSPAFARRLRRGGVAPESSRIPDRMPMGGRGLADESPATHRQSVRASRSEGHQCRDDIHPRCAAGRDDSEPT